MNARAAALTAAALLGGGGAVWFGPSLLDPLGLGEFVYIGEACLAMLILTGLDRIFTRFAPH